MSTDLIHRSRFQDFTGSAYSGSSPLQSSRHPHLRSPCPGIATCQKTIAKPETGRPAPHIARHDSPPPDFPLRHLPRSQGEYVRHYGLTDHKEFFAEMTEAYFGSNDFFPFNRGELKTAEPGIYQLMVEIGEPSKSVR